MFVTCSSATVAIACFELVPLTQLKHEGAYILQADVVLPPVVTRDSYAKCTLCTAQQQEKDVMMTEWMAAPIETVLDLQAMAAAWMAIGIQLHPVTLPEECRFRHCAAAGLGCNHKDRCWAAPCSLSYCGSE